MALVYNVTAKATCGYPSSGPPAEEMLFSHFENVPCLISPFSTFDEG
jgi:hypothetical protein